MNKTAYITIRIEQNIKNKASKILQEVGFTPSQVFTIVLKQTITNKRFLCDLLTPNQETLKAMHDIEKRRTAKETNLEKLRRQNP